jgi:multicomponent Na+:H+ antiporter subunit C
VSDFTLLTLLAGALGLIAIGLAGLVLSRNLFRIVLALSLAESGANLLLVLVGFRRDAIAPIIEPGRALMTMVDPIPQAMVLTSIVIGVGVQAFALALAIRARNAYGTLDMDAMRHHMEADIDKAAGTTPASSQHAPAGRRPLPPPMAEPPRLAHKEPQP